MSATLTKDGDVLKIKLEGRWSEIAEAKDKVREIPGRRWDPTDKVWTVPADPKTADRILKSIRPDTDEELMAWLRESLVSYEESLTSPLPDDAADLQVPWAYCRAPWQPEEVNDDPVKGLDSKQRSAVAAMVEWRRALLCDDMGLGKLQSVSTPVLTPAGWRTMGELRPGDHVIGSNGRPTAVEAVFPQGVKPLYRVTMKDGSSTLAGEEHLWAVKSPNDRKRGGDFRVLTTAQLLPTRDVAGNRRWSVPLVGPVEFETLPEPLPIDPYTLGVLLGDGGLTSRTPVITAHEDDAEELLGRCKFVGDDFARGHKDPQSWGIVGTSTRKALQGLGLYNHKSPDKFIPECYLRATPTERLELLRGLMDTDGWCFADCGTSAGFSSSSACLADGVQELVRSLGGTASRRLKKTTHLDAHAITIKLPRGVVPFHLKRKAALCADPVKYPLVQPIDSIEYERDEEAVCIRVAARDSLYVTEDYIVTHNTLTAISAVEEHVLRNPAGDGVTHPSGPRLIISPASVMGSWSRELHRWLEDPNVQIADGDTPAKRHEQITRAIQEDAWLIVNWEQLRVKKVQLKRRTRQGTVRRQQLVLMKEPLFEYPQAASLRVPVLDDDGQVVGDREQTWKDWDDPLLHLRADKEFKSASPMWLAVLADEIHRAKNRTSQQTKGLHRIEGQLMFGMTGTPLMNSPDELWALLRWLWPAEYHERGANYSPGAMAFWQFYTTYVDFWEDHYGRKVVTGVNNPDALRYALKDKVIRRTAPAGGRKRIFLEVPLTPKQQKLYDEAEKAMWLEVEREASAGDSGAIQLAQKAAEGAPLVDLLRIPNGAARFVRLQQIIENAALLGGPDESGAMDDFEQKYQDSRPEPWIVFCKYKESCNLLAERLRRKHGAIVEIYNGDVPAAHRTQIEDAFQAGEVDVIVGTIDAMYQGITLTKSHLQYWLSRDVVPAKNEQGEARQDRKGQQHRVLVYIPQAPDTVATDKVHVINRLKEGIVKTVIPQIEIEEA